MSSDSLKARLAAATPGNWVYEPKDGAPDYYWPIGPHVPYQGLVVGCAKGSTPANSDLIAHAPTDLAAALKVVEAAQANPANIVCERPVTYMQGEWGDLAEGPCGECGGCVLADALAAWEALP